MLSGTPDRFEREIHAPADSETDKRYKGGERERQRERDRETEKERERERERDRE